MGKITGFLEYTRQEAQDRDPAERVRDWEPFHHPLPERTRRQQGGRCMNCGVPYCQSGMMWEGHTFGCPLHNLIPEWNDMIWAGNPLHALSRLLKTNNFPEFTGRVCPAPCEDACICGLYGDAVTIRDNELSIIEAAFCAGAVGPQPPKVRTGKKVAVVGSGPAGLAAADQLNHRGHSVTIIEREEHPGGLLTYGIPNMKLPKSVVQRRVDRMCDEGISFVTGVDAADPAVARRLLAEYDAVILCCGAERPRPLNLNSDGISGVLYGTAFLKAAVERQQFGKEPSAPTAEGRDVVVIGTGDTASDCVATALRQGCRSVVQLVRRPQEDYLKDGVLPLDYAHEEALAVTGRDPRQFGVQVRELTAELLDTGLSRLSPSAPDSAQRLSALCHTAALPRFHNLIGNCFSRSARLRSAARTELCQQIKQDEQKHHKQDSPQQAATESPRLPKEIMMVYRAFSIEMDSLHSYEICFIKSPRARFTSGRIVERLRCTMYAIVIYSSHSL